MSNGPNGPLPDRALGVMHYGVENGIPNTDEARRARAEVFGTGEWQ